MKDLNGHTKTTTMKWYRPEWEQDKPQIMMVKFQNIKIPIHKTHFDQYNWNVDSENSKYRLNHLTLSTISGFIPLKHLIFQYSMPQFYILNLMNILNL